MSYLHVFHPIWVLGRGGGGGGLPGDWYTTCLCTFSPWASPQMLMKGGVWVGSSVLGELVPQAPSDLPPPNKCRLSEGDWGEGIRSGWGGTDSHS